MKRTRSDPAADANSADGSRHTNVLNLPRLSVTQVIQTDRCYQIKAKASMDPVACPQCQHAGLVGFGRNVQTIKDVPMHGKRVEIYFDTRRFRCKQCGVTFLEKHPDFHMHRAMTARLVSWIGAQSIKRTFASLADETGVVEGTVRNIFRDHIAELEATVRFETPQWLGIEEIHLIKPRGVIANIAKSTVVDLLVNSNQNTLAQYLSGLNGKDQVQWVVMNLSKPFKTAVNAELPQATLVIDKFHIAKMADEATEKVRRAIRSDLSLAQKRGLLNDRVVLQKREADLTDKERSNLDSWAKKYPMLIDAYRLKEALLGVYQAPSADQAMQAFDHWSNSIPPELDDHFHALKRALLDWRAEILNYFEQPPPTDAIKALNSLNRVADRMGRGYSFEALRAQVLFTQGVHSAEGVYDGASIATLARWIETGEI